VYGVARSLSSEWSGRGIRANAIAPGYFRTELTEAVFADADRYAEMLARIPMGRFGDPEELAGAAVFLASDAASYLTGQLITVDGGWTAA
jgi:NAD(P)-dependent dehydrogenase (short-subunit alcohol dehydrogenase family)